MAARKASARNPTAGSWSGRAAIMVSSTLGRRGRRFAEGFSTATRGGSPIAVRMVIPRPAAVAESRPFRLELVNDTSQPMPARFNRSEEHTSELQSLMRISYAVFCLKKKHTQTKLKID